MANPTAQQNRALSDYTKLLNEARVRMNALGVLISDDSLPLPQGVRVESAYLQIRMLCEVVALGCLTVHGYLPGTQVVNMQSSYKADFILNKLEGLHAKFYLVPVTVTDTPLGDGRTNHHMDPITSGFLKRSELIALYRKCGDRIHRGSIRKFQSDAEHVWDEDFRVLGELWEKLHTLLRTHLISSLDGRAHYLCHLSNAQVNGDALVALATAPD